MKLRTDGLVNVPACDEMGKYDGSHRYEVLGYWRERERERERERVCFIR